MLVMDLDEAQARITQNVRKLMGPCGYDTQEALGEKIGKKAPEMSGRMKGRTKWTLPDILALADALGLAPALLLQPLKVSITTSLPATGTDDVVTISPVTGGHDGLPTIEATTG